METNHTQQLSAKDMGILGLPCGQSLITLVLDYSNDMTVINFTATEYYISNGMRIQTDNIKRLRNIAVYKYLDEIMSVQNNTP